MANTSVWHVCCKVFRYKKRTLAVLFFTLEAISFILDQYGGRHLGFLVASVFLSLVGFLITAYNFTESRSEVENQREVIELVFSIVQLIVTYIYFVCATLEVKLKLNAASIFPLVLAITALALAFKNNEQVTDLSAVQTQLISLNTSMVGVETTDSLAPGIQGASSDASRVDDEEEITDSSALLCITSSNAPAEIDDHENADMRAPLVSSNTPMTSDDEEVSTPRGWYDVDEGTGWSTDVDEETVWSTDVDEETESTAVEASIFASKERFNLFLSTDLEPEKFFTQRSRLPPHMTSAQSNLWQSTKLFSVRITKTDLEKELIVPTRVMKHFLIPEGKEFVDLLVKDLKEKFWNFRFTVYPKPALTDGWLEFVKDKDLARNDIVTFYKLRDEIFGEQYRVEVDSEYRW